ncbi:MAG: heat-inducible transcription repressor HrcA [Myxococcales bacterium]|nr:heat-inducible transcription repressor HrcA [Myxococcales bacterium]
MTELPYRARRILYAAITEYIATGEPVGSRTLAKRYGINLSPATIRNVLADLEEAGLVRQPHTSAGRVPTDKGFRLFVDALVQMREVAAEDRAAVLQRLRGLVPGSDVLKEAGEVLSALTGAAGVVTAPRAEHEQLSQLRFMRLRGDQLLVVLVTRSGAVENRVVTIAGELDDRVLERVNNLLDELLTSQTRSLASVRDALAAEMDAERGTIEQLRAEARRMVDAAVGDDRPAKVVIEGQGRLFDRPEFLDGEKIRSYLRAFDDKERLLGLLEDTLLSGGVRVLIGQEAGLGAVDDVSLVATSYGRSGSAGTLGVIGPTRMDYAKVVPLVGFTAKVMGDILAGKTEALEEDE